MFRWVTVQRCRFVELAGTCRVPSAVAGQRWACVERPWTVLPASDKARFGPAPKASLSCPAAAASGGHEGGKAAALPLL